MLMFYVTQYGLQSLYFYQTTESFLSFLYASMDLGHIMMIFFFYFLLTTTINRKFDTEWLFLRKIVKIIHCLTKKTHRTCWLIQINSLRIFQRFFKEKGDFLERGGITLIPFWSGVLPKNKEFRISIQLTITFYEVILIWLSEDQVLWYVICVFLVLPFVIMLSSNHRHYILLVAEINKQTDKWFSSKGISSVWLTLHTSKITQLW